MRLFLLPTLHTHYVYIYRSRSSEYMGRTFPIITYIFILYIIYKWKAAAEKFVIGSVVVSWVETEKLLSDCDGCSSSVSSGKYISFSSSHRLALCRRHMYEIFISVFFHDHQQQQNQQRECSCMYPKWLDVETLYIITCIRHRYLYTTRDEASTRSVVLLLMMLLIRLRAIAVIVAISRISIIIVIIILIIGTASSCSINVLLTLL